MAYITTEKLQQMIEGAPKGVTPDSIVQELENRGHTIQGKSTDEQGNITGGFGTKQIEGAPDVQKVERGGLFSRWKGTLEDSGEKFRAIADRVVTPKEGQPLGQNPLSTAIQTVGTAAGTAGELAFDVAEEGVGQLPDPVKQAGTKAAELGIRAALGDKAFESLPEVAAKYSDWAAKHPQAAADISGIINIASILPVGRGAKVGVDAAESAGKAVTREALRSTDELAEGAARFASGTSTEGLSGLAEIGETALSKVGRGLQSATEAVTRKGQIRELPVFEREALRRGVPEEVTGVLKSVDSQSLPKFRQMVSQAAEKLSTNSPKVPRPLQTVGDELVQTASVLSQELKQTGKMLGEVKKKLQGVKIDIPTTRQSLLDDIDEIGLKVNKEGKLVPQKGVPVEDDVLEVMQEVQEFLGNPRNVAVSKIDARNLDRLRSYLRKSFTSKGVPLQGRAQGLAEKYRNALLSDISTVSDEYATLARQYAEQIGALEDFTKLIGYKGNLESITEKGLRAGEVARRVLGNAADRPMSVIDNLVSEAQKAGYTGADDIFEMIQFSDDLEQLINFKPSTGLAGQVERGSESALSRIPKVGPALEGLSRVGQFTPEERLKALTDLLDSMAR